MEKSFNNKSHNNQKYKNDKQFWEFSAVNVQRCYRQVVLHLQSKHKFNLQEKFTNEEFTSLLQKKLGDMFWNELYTAFRVWVQRKFNFVFVQENSSLKMAHLQFMHQTIMRSFQKVNDELPSKQDDFDRVKRITRKYMYNTQQKNGSLTIDLLCGQVVHQFTQKPLLFGYSEYQSCLSVIMQCVQDSRQNLKSVKLQVNPCGIQLQARYYNKEWCLATKQLLRVNECKFLAQKELFEVFVSLLSKYSLHLDDLNKDYLYTFVLVYGEYSPLPAQDQLYLVSIFDTVHKTTSKEDKVKSSDLPRLPSQIVNLEQQHYKYYDIKNDLNERMQLLLHSYSNTTPMFSVIVKVKKHLFEIETELAQPLCLLQDKLSQFKSKDLSDFNSREYCDKFLKTYADELLTNNKYLQFLNQSESNLIDQI